MDYKKAFEYMITHMMTNLDFIEEYLLKNNEETINEATKLLMLRLLTLNHMSLKPFATEIYHDHNLKRFNDKYDTLRKEIKFAQLDYMNLEKSFEELVKTVANS